MLVGVFDGKALRYRGRVGTGFGGDVAQMLRKQLGPLARKASPFDGVQPANIVGAIAHTADLAGSQINGVEIRDDHTLVRLPASHVTVSRW